MPTPIIRTATTSDDAPVIDVVVLAFSADPAARWTWPDPRQYLTRFPSNEDNRDNYRCSQIVICSGIRNEKPAKANDKIDIERLKQAYEQ